MIEPLGLTPCEDDSCVMEPAKNSLGVLIRNFSAGMVLCVYDKFLDNTRFSALVFIHTSDTSLPQFKLQEYKAGDTQGHKPRVGRANPVTPTYITDPAGTNSDRAHEKNEFKNGNHSAFASFSR
jgi:hypothetical protein